MKTNPESDLNDELRPEYTAVDFEKPGARQIRRPFSPLDPPGSAGT